MTVTSSLLLLAVVTGLTLLRWWPDEVLCRISNDDWFVAVYGMIPEDKIWNASGFDEWGPDDAALDRALNSTWSYRRLGALRIIGSRYLIIKPRVDRIGRLCDDANTSVAAAAKRNFDGVPAGNLGWQWLLNHQQPDGGWPAGKSPISSDGFIPGRVGATALAMLSWDEAGFDHRVPSRWKRPLRAGVGFLTAAQNPQGAFAADLRDHALALYILARLSFDDVGMLPVLSRGAEYLSRQPIDATNVTTPSSTRYLIPRAQFAFIFLKDRLEGKDGIDRGKQALADWSHVANPPEATDQSAVPFWNTAAGECRLAAILPLSLTVSHDHFQTAGAHQGLIAAADTPDLSPLGLAFLAEALARIDDPDAAADRALRRLRDRVGAQFRRRLPDIGSWAPSPQTEGDAALTGIAVWLLTQWRHQPSITRPTSPASPAPTSP